MLNHLDLFSGVGGFAKGLEDAGGFETVAFCEMDPFCRQVLKKHWPKVHCHEDIRSIRGLSLSELERGRKANGRSEPCLRPDWVVIENGFHRWRAWVPELRRELYKRGYASVPFRVCASDIGAHHRRARVFLIANADSVKLRELSWWWHGQGREVAKKLAESRHWAPSRLGMDDGISNAVDRRHALGNAIIPQISTLIGRAILNVERERCA